MPYFPPTASSAEKVIWALPGFGVVQGAAFTVDAGGSLPVTRFDDGQNNDTWHMPFRATSAINGLSISLIRIHYRLIGTTDRNLLLINTLYKYPAANDSALVTDNDGGLTYATGTGTAGNHKYIDVSSTAYNGIGAVGTGDWLGMVINRQGADATDTYAQNWEVLMVEITFA